MGVLHGLDLEGTCNFPPEFSHLATFTAGMVGNTIQVCPGSWKTMFGDHLASLCPI